MPTKNFDKTFENFKGDVMKDEKDQPAIMRDLIVIALLNSFPDERATAQEKVKRFNLANKISKGGDQELDINELKMIDDLVAKSFNTLTYGRISEYLNSN